MLRPNWPVSQQSKSSSHSLFLSEQSNTRGTLLHKSPKLTKIMYVMQNFCQGISCISSSDWGGMITLWKWLWVYIGRHFSMFSSYLYSPWTNPLSHTTFSRTLKMKIAGNYQRLKLNTCQPITMCVLTYCLSKFMLSIWLLFSLWVRVYKFMRWNLLKISVASPYIANE